ncbi:MAG: S8 family serine peptidase, partial [Steroidobacteraceae bacterium]
MKRFAGMLIALLLLAGRAEAQLALPQLPPVPVPVPVPAPGQVLGVADSTLATTLRAAREIRERALLRRFPRDLERDPRGAPVARSVILALSPSESALASARAAGFTVRSDEPLEALGERVVTMVAPPNLSTRRALDQLRRRDPGGRYDFSHVYFESAAQGAFDAGAPTSEPPAAVSPTVRIGLVDSGVRRDHPAFAAVRLETFGCSGRSVPSVHGTAVASLLVGRAANFHGSAPGATLFAADAWCGDEMSGGRVEDIVRSLSWLAGQSVSVVNLSVVGPKNLVLETIVKRVQERGLVIVAAAGNDGPSAPPLYPAAYPGVIAVTAVDVRQRALIEAARGKHVRFAAPGADLMAASVSPDYAVVRGTSFAAPIIAGLIATRIGTGLDANAALRSLALEARDL